MHEHYRLIHDIVHDTIEKLHVILLSQLLQKMIDIYLMDSQIHSEVREQLISTLFEIRIIQ